MSNQEEREKFIADTTIRIRDKAIGVLSKSEVISSEIENLQSLGVHCNISYEVKVTVVIPDNFVVPKDLSKLNEIQLNGMITKEDIDLINDVPVDENEC